jgi:hypothetical protein
MTWIQYEVWSVDEHGHETLVETTNSLKQAQVLAEKVLTDDIVECIIRKDEDGEVEDYEIVVRE